MGATPDLAITDTNFHHVVVTRSTSNMIFYLDGVQGRATNLDDQFEFTTNAAIGARGDNFQNSFFGSIDEATVYNRALTQTEIQAVFNAATAGKCEATSTQLDGMGGVYCEDCDIAEAVTADFTGGYGVKPWARDDALADRLWALSETWI